MALRYLILVFAAFCFTETVIDSNYRDLEVRFPYEDSGFFPIPQTVAEIKQNDPAEYVFGTHDEEHNVDLYSFPNDPRVFILYDTYGTIAGIRICYIKEDVAILANNNSLEFDSERLFDKKPLFRSGNYMDTPLWHTTVLFVSPEKLKAGGRAYTGGQVLEELYAYLDGVWTLITTDECQIEAQGFTKQGCFDGMGQHYFYKMHPDADCFELQGVFVYYVKGKLIGIGVLAFGMFTQLDRLWFEKVPNEVIEAIVPNRATCLMDWINNFATTSLHLFFQTNASELLCKMPWQNPNQCEQTN